LNGTIIERTFEIWKVSLTFHRAMYGQLNQVGSKI
jgi:hypothetical protein